MSKEENFTTQTEIESFKKKPSAFRKFVKKHPVMTTIFFGLIVVVAVYFFKDVQGNLEKKALTEAANVRLKENNEAMLKVLSKSIVWSIRSEMLRGNIEQVDLLISDLVKENNFQYIHMIEPSGNVLLSTNKKLEGQLIDDAYIVSNLNNDSTVLLNGTDSIIILVSPVMGYDSRLGTMVLGYKFVDL